MVSCLGSAQGKRLIENIVRGVELPINGLSAGDPRERVGRGAVLAVPLVVEGYEGSCVDEEPRLGLPVEDLVVIDRCSLGPLSPVLSFTPTERYVKNRVLWVDA